MSEAPGPSAEAPSLVVATYNVHRCIGADRRHDPDRVAAVIRELGADVVALQELSSRAGLEGGIDQAEYLARAANLVAVPGPTLETHRGEYGNALLTRLPIARIDRSELSVRGREPRGALDVELRSQGRTLRVVATHLGLRRRERREQVGRLLALLEAHASSPVVLLGDMNEWFPWRHSLRPLEARFGRTPRLRSFPSFWPLVALDRLFVEPPNALRSVRVHRSPASRRASDHLPLRAEIRLVRRAETTAEDHPQGGR